MSNIEQFGKYLLLEKIAAGGMAEVYLAKSVGATGLNKFFAIKRILPQFSSNEEFVAMFKEEANVAINLNHGNVVSIFDFGIEKSQFYLVMDFVEGRNLRQIINELKKNNKSFSIDQALFMIKETAAGLDHAHRCTDTKTGRPLNITHRDMSPQNIMVSFEGEVKVIDFGIAKAETEQEETKAGTLKGKFGYMSPEQAEGLPIDPRTDVFALGIVLWELLANDRLFTGSNEATILRKVRDCQIPSIRKINPTIPFELERIVMKALTKDRNFRYQTAANFHRDLNRFLNTHYPDFSAQDFSQFIKDSFKESYLEGREKLIEFAKIESPRPTKTEETITSALPPIPQNKTAQLNQKNDSENYKNATDLPPGFSENEPQSKISLDGVLNADMGTPRKRRNIPAIAPGQIPGVTPNVQQSKPSQLHNTALHKTAITNLHKTRVTQNFKNPNSNSNADLQGVLIKSVVVVALVFLGLWYWKVGSHSTALPNNPITKTNGLNKSTNPTNVISANQNENAGESELASQASIKVSVTSQPAGAFIYLNGRDTGYITPAVISVTAKTEAKFVLRKDGYLEYETTKAFDQTGQLMVTLQPTAKAGYLNIYLSNGGSNTKIYVNEKELVESTPVKKYPIVAEVETVVKAYNPITLLTDELHIKLKPGETKDIELILGRSKGKIK